MGNHCHKTGKKPKPPGSPDQLKGLAQPPTLKNASPDKKVRDETNREHISLSGEKDPHKIYEKLISLPLTEVLQSDSFNLDNYLSKLKDIDIDVLLGIVKKMENSLPKNEKMKKIEKEFKSLKDNFSEYQSKHLSLQPKETKDFAMKFLRLFVETYHVIKIHENIQEKEDKPFYRSWNTEKTGDYQTDLEYLAAKYVEIDNEMRKFFGGNLKNEKNEEKERNIEIYKNVTNVFIQEIFEFTIKKTKEESFVEDPFEKFGKESDHKAMKCFDYKFEIHMMSH